MDANKTSEELLNDIYKNAHIALQSISNLIPELDDEKNAIKAELKDEYELYEKFMSELSTFMKDQGIERKDINAIKKAFMWGSIKMNTLAGTEDSHIAEMMLQGTLMGITDLRTMLNGTDGELQENVKKFAKELLEIEEGFETKLKKFL